jgi:MtN3 and saliva related transmembrane protein
MIESSTALAVSSIAATLTTVAFLPQALRIIRLRETEAISLSMYVTFAAGVTAWLAYGLLVWNWPIILANGVTLMLALIILALKLRYG